MSLPNGRTNNRTFRLNHRQITRVFFGALRQSIEKYDLVMKYGRRMKDLHRNFRIIVLDDGESIVSDEQMQRSLRKPFLGSSGFIEQMYKTYFPC